MIFLTVLIAIPVIVLIAFFLYCAFSCFSAAGCAELLNENEDKNVEQLLLDYEIAEELGESPDTLAALEKQIDEARKESSDETMVPQSSVERSY